MRRAVNNFNQRGDTIVEVLLAMTVLALVVGTAYSISSRALTQSQRAQERMQAVKYAEGQIERLKYLASSENQQTYNQLVLDLSTKYECIKDDNTLAELKPVEPLNGCIKDGLYQLAFRNYDSATKTFEFKVEWDAFRSDGKDNVTYYYRAK